MKKILYLFLVIFIFFICSCSKQGETGNGISSIDLTNQEGLMDTYTITYTNGDKTTFTVKNGENGEQGIQGIQGEPGKDGHTPVITIQNGYWYVDGVNTMQECQGVKGDTGNGISSIKLSKSVGIKDTYTITYTDGATSTFVITNGSKGDQGIQGIQGEPGKDGHTPVITIQNGYWYIDGSSTDVIAEGLKGDTGNGISSIKLTNTNGLIDTYTIYFTDGTTSSFMVTNGKEGDQGIQGIQGEPGKEGHTPVITIQNGNWYIDGVDTLQPAQGGKGDTGNGISSIKLTSTNGLVDTYTIYFTDGTESTFYVTNGEQGPQGDKGEQGEQGEPGLSIVGIVSDYKGNVTIKLSDGSSYSISIKEIACEHSYSQVVTYPTCSEKGYTTYTCINCGHEYINTYTPSVGHHYVNGSCVFCKETEKYGAIDTDITWYNESSETYTLSNRNELAGLSYLVSTGINFSGKTIYLGNNIDLGGLEWIPIGSSNNVFKGTFDGNNFAIYNLKISIYSNDYVGLFGYISNATIKNVKVLNSNIQSSKNYVGIMSGYSSNTSFSNISVSGYVDAEESTYVGGIAGYVNVSGSYSFTNCENTVNITGTAYVGGIFGYLYGKGGKYTITFTDNINSGKVVSNSDYTGGMCGSLFICGSTYSAEPILTAINLENTGYIKGKLYAGGFFGSCSTDSRSSILKDSSSSGKITGTAYVGGLIGESSLLNIENCSNEGTEIECLSYTLISSEKYAYAGGYIGKAVNSSIANCKNKSNINYDSEGTCIGGIVGCVSVGITCSLTNCENTGSITGVKYVGGISGFLLGNSTNDYSITFADNSNSGKIVSSSDYAGGICGLVSVSTYYSTDNVNLTVVNLANKGSVVGNLYVGGLFGSSSNSDGSFIIKDSSSSGKITGTAYVGGLIGDLSYGNIDNCSNGNAEIECSSYTIISGEKYAYVGGCVGKAVDSSITNCKNYSTINYTSEGMCVGGIAGYVSVGGSCSFTNCENIGNITGTKYVGGIFGYLYGNPYGDFTITFTDNINSGKIISRNDYVGGMCGSLNVSSRSTGGEGVLLAVNLENTSSIEGKLYVGGLFGSSITDSGSSTLKDSSSSGKITGTSYVGGLIGESSYLNIDNCSNEVTTFNCSSYYIDSYGNKEVFLGGFVGAMKYSIISNCINSSNITYSNEGLYVGGIAGYVFITSTKKFVGLENNGTIKGNSCVGGLFGMIEASSSNASTLYISSSGNNGYVSGIFEKVGGLVGYLYTSSNYGEFGVNAVDIFNLNTVRGYKYVGGLIGYLETDSNTFTFDTTTVDSVFGNYDYGRFIGYISDGRSLTDFIDDFIKEL